jgi:3-oxoadipate enol-lactonase/4-carboxymuconolactone decarboxylase
VIAQERRDELVERYNKQAVKTGQELQGEFFLRMLHEMDEVDPIWTEVWLTWIYDHMYNRRIIDDRTRVLVVIGECVVGGHTDQIANHMRSALEAGATTQEIREVILQASIYSGMPNMIRALRIYRQLMVDLGLVDYTEPPFRGDARDARPSRAAT